LRNRIASVTVGGTMAKLRGRVARCLVLLVAIAAIGCQTNYPATSRTPLTIPELKYRLMDQFGPVAFCGPPVAKGGEAAKADAVAAFPEIQEDRDAFNAIVRRTGLANVTAFTAEQKVTVFNEYERLKAIALAPVGDRQHFALTFADPNDSTRTVFMEGTIDQYGAIQVTRRESRDRLNCPICLAIGTLIDTLAGPVRVEDVRPGTHVWTADGAGRRVVATVVRTTRTPVPRSHEVVHIRLQDGRELYASPGHPSASGRPLADLVPGDVLDTSTVVVAERVSYWGEATFDLLPSGQTGEYWANGILLRSTLSSDKRPPRDR
jgi:hypothetical protein